MQTIISSQNQQMTPPFKKAFEIVTAQNLSLTPRIAIAHNYTTAALK